MTKVTKGEWWFKGNPKLKFYLGRFYIQSFEILKIKFPFYRENFRLEIEGKEIKKIGYNFFMDGKRVKKQDVVDWIDKHSKYYLD